MLFWFVMMVVLWILRDLGGIGGWQNVFKDGWEANEFFFVCVCGSIDLVIYNINDFLALLLNKDFLNVG